VYIEYALGPTSTATEPSANMTVAAAYVERPWPTLVAAFELSKRFRQPIKAPHTFYEDNQDKVSFHRRICHALDEVVRGEFTSVLVNIIAQPGMQRAEFATGDFAWDIGMRLQRGRIKLRG
jgi:hypothetical protein